MDLKNGLIVDAKFIFSPNCNDYPNADDISLLVIHSISLPPGIFGGDEIIQLFTNTLDSTAHPYFKGIADLKVSAHALIRRDGECIQFVPFTKRAWHAGVSQFGGREQCNDFSLGIELEGTPDSEFTEAQYQTLAQLTQSLLKHYPKITRERIVGHSEIAPGRKLDPGQTFDWKKYFSLIDFDSQKQL
jgi:N-acetyl-anhydromuramoyl-L-alanine amidase